MDDPMARAMSAVRAFACGEDDLEPTLTEIAASATDALGADMAGLTIRDDRGRPTTVVYTDRMVAEIDQVQYAALDRPDATEGAASLIEKRPPAFPRLGQTSTTDQGGTC